MKGAILCALLIVFVTPLSVAAEVSVTPDAASYAPSKPEELYRYGVTLMRYGQHDRAEKIFELFVEKFAPGSKLSAAAQFQLGRCRQLSGDLKGAWEAYHTVILRHRKEHFWRSMARVRKKEVEQEIAEEEAIPEE